MKNSYQSKTKIIDSCIKTKRLNDERTIMTEEGLLLFKILTTPFGNSQSSKSQEQTLNCVLDFPVVVSFFGCVVRILYLKRNKDG